MLKSKWGWYKPLCAFALSFLALAAAHGAAGESRRLSLYSCLVESENHEVFRAFERDTGITIKHVRLSAGEAIARLMAEGANPKVSVMLGGSEDAHLTAAGAEILSPYVSRNTVSIPEQYRNHDGLFTPFAMVVTAFVSNREWLEENGMAAPSSWADLLDERYRRNVCIGQPAISGAAYTALCSVLQLFGEDEGFDYLKKLDRNILQYAKTGAAPMRMAGLGETGVAIGFDLDGEALADEGYPLVVTYPEEGTGYELTCAAIVRNGPPEEEENARRFIDWLLEAGTQRLFAERFHRFPMDPSVEGPRKSLPFESMRLLPMDPEWASKNKKRLLERFEREVRNRGGR